MTYYDTPIGTEKQNQTTTKIRNNFSQANNSFSVDHIGFDDLTSQNGYHNQLTMAEISGAAHPTTAAGIDKFYAMEDTANVGLIQYSRGPSDAIPTPVTKLHSGSSPITLLINGTTNVLDFTGITRAMCYLLAANMVSSGNNTARAIYWTGSALIITGTTTTLDVVSTGNILQLKNIGVPVMSNVFWSLELFRLQ